MQLRWREDEKVISSRYKNDELDRVNCIKLYCLKYRKKKKFVTVVFPLPLLPVEEQE